MKKFPYAPGQKFGKLTTIQRFPPTNNETSARWLCRCDCGKLVKIITRNLPSKKGCGCSRITHGNSQKQFYSRWHTMMKRCYDPKCKKYKNYGGRGIIVCEEWKNPKSLHIIEQSLGAWPGPGFSIGRINNDGNYEPANCRWEDDFQQAWNRRKPKSKSKYRGIWPRGRKWAAKIVSLGKIYRLGIFDNEEDAARAVDKKALELRGSSAILNFP